MTCYISGRDDARADMPPMWLIASAFAAPVAEGDLAAELDAVAAREALTLLLPADAEALAGLRARPLPLNVRLDPVVLDATQRAARVENRRGACVYGVARTDAGWDLAALAGCRAADAPRPPTMPAISVGPAPNTPVGADQPPASAPPAPTSTAAAPTATPPVARDPAPSTGRRNPPDLSAKLLTFHRDRTAPGGWWVSGPGGLDPVDSVRFARMTLDDSRSLAFEAARTRATAPRIGMGVAGSAGVVAGMALLGAAGPALTVPSEPDPLAYTSQLEYMSARDDWESRQSAADVRDELLTNGAALLALSSICWVSIPFIGGEARAVLRHPGLTWSATEGRSSVEAYNARVWASVGLGPNGVELTMGLP